MAADQRESAQASARSFGDARCFVVGVGAQKSATSWLSDWLMQHPEVHLFPGKEVHYWDALKLSGRNGVPEMLDNRLRKARRGLRARLGLLLGRGRAAAQAQSIAEHRAVIMGDGSDHEAYKALLMKGHRGEPVVGEFTPAYAMLDAAALAEIAALHPNTRFLFLMRDPVDRHVSSVKHFLGEGRVLPTGAAGPTERDFEERCLASARDRSSPVYRRGDYRAAIAALEAAVPADRIFYGFFETITSDAELRRLARFLGIAELPGEAERRVNVARQSFRGAGDTALLEQLEDAFGDVYAFVHQRFGPAVPDSWRGRSGSSAS